MNEPEFSAMPAEKLTPPPLEPRVEAALKASMRENRELLKELEAL